MGHPSPAREAPTVSSPKLLPRKRPVDKKVFLEEELWLELADAARFHTQVFTEMGSEETVSRNDLIDVFLRWALKEYWEDKGGKPVTDKERADKAKRYAQKLQSAEKKLNG